jgi:hypothetical protein
LKGASKRCVQGQATPGQASAMREQDRLTRVVFT